MFAMDQQFETSNTLVDDLSSGYTMDQPYDMTKAFPINHAEVHLSDSAVKPSEDLQSREWVNPSDFGLHSSVDRSTSPASSRHSPYPTQLRDRSSSVSKTKDAILLLLPTRTPPIQPSQYLNAKCLGSSVTLSQMVRNHRAMANLLNTFNLDPSHLDVIHKFADEENISHQLTAKAVLRACGWKESTFKNKASRYQNAEKAAKMSWNGELPAIGLSFHST
ncbi:hypothetical protein B0H10DRAFT_1940204 [Mycena sp. CBHHK59/15]|nr:hypothetical protein B0H10DRAFT_1940204 [Mycena sp. CBHHK59/15]